MYDYLKERKEDTLSGSLKENVIEEGETKEESTERKRDERKKTLHEEKLQGKFMEKKPGTLHTSFQGAGSIQTDITVAPQKARYYTS